MMLRNHRIFSHKKRGASMLGYALLLGLISVVAIGSIGNLGEKVEIIFGGAAKDMEDTVAIYEPSATSLNVAPEFSGLSDINIVFGDQVPEITGILSDFNDAPESLTFTVTSSNQSLMPAAEISIIGPDSGGNFSIPLNYPHDSGSFSVTLYASDGHFSTSEVVNVSVSPATAVNIVAAGANGCVSTPSGTGVCWGFEFGNGVTLGFGQLGNGVSATETRVTPVPISDVTDFAWLEGGPSRTCGVTTGKDLYCWGRGSNGTNGPAGTFVQTVPALIPLSDVDDIGFILPTSCAAAGGLGYCWGSDSHGYFGDGPGQTPNSSAPIQVSNITNVTRIDVGKEHACAIADGDVYCWGEDTFGEVGQGVAGDGIGGSVIYDTPQQVIGLANAVDVAAGGFVTCAIVNSPNNDLYCWGFDQLGGVGNGEPDAFGDSITVPQLILSNNVTHLSEYFGSSADVYCAVQAGQLLCWGRNNWGELGVNAIIGTNPAPVILPTNGTVTSLGVTSAVVCFIAGGLPYCQGRGDFGQLGDGRPVGGSNSSSPILPNGF